TWYAVAQTYRGVAGGSAAGPGVQVKSSAAAAAAGSLVVTVVSSRRRVSPAGSWPRPRIGRGSSYALGPVAGATDLGPAGRRPAGGLPVAGAGCQNRLDGIPGQGG